jgi:hypothetical protein
MKKYLEKEFSLPQGHEFVLFIQEQASVPRFRVVE